MITNTLHLLMLERKLDKLEKIISKLAEADERIKDIKGSYQKDLLKRLGLLEEEVPEPKEELVLEDGCWYEDGEGNKYQVRKLDDSNSPFRAENYQCEMHNSIQNITCDFCGWFTRNGKFYGYENDETKKHLIKKVPPPIQLEVDSFWRTRDGNKVYIYHIHENICFGLMVGKYAIQEWDIKGTFSYQNKHPNKHPYDIVAKWEG